jgi:hypothetical protein
MTGITPGEEWGIREDAAPDLTVAGDDADLAAAIRTAPPGVLVAFSPSPASGLARTLGLRVGAPGRGLALPMDAIELADGTLAVNTVVLGPPPDRLTAADRAGDVTVTVDGREQAYTEATTVVVATGQWLRGADLVPRGHPGDGRCEVQVYRLRRGERRPMRARLPTGTHLPHPRIVTRTAVLVEAQASRPLSCEIDGRPVARTATLRARLLPARYRLSV